MQPIANASFCRPHHSEPPKTSPSNIYKLIMSLLLLLAITLATGCREAADTLIRDYSPANSQVFYLDPGETMAFEISGPTYVPYVEGVRQVGVMGQWSVHQYEPSQHKPRNRAGERVENIPVTSSDANRFTFTAPVDQASQYYLVTYSVYEHFLNTEWIFADSSRSWLIYVGEKNQTSAQWKGSFLVSNTEDLEKISGYSGISGSLSIMPFSDPDSKGRFYDDTVVIVRNDIEGREIEHEVFLGTRNQAHLITDLNALSSLNQIGGNLTIANNEHLTSFEGLNSLQVIDGQLVVYRNNLIKNLSGFENIQTLGKDLYIERNHDLESISELHWLTGVNGAAIISGNDKLSSLSGLNNITTVQGRLEISGNSLVSLAGLANLSVVNDYFRLHDNDKLESLFGLGSLTTVGDYIYIDSNNSLTTLQGLSSIESVRQLSIVFNPLLVDLTGLENIKIIPGVLTLMGNKSLSSLAALKNLESVFRLSIGSNNRLESLSGLDSLTYLEDGLLIYSNKNLTSIESLNQIQSLGRLFRFTNNDSLCDSTALTLLELLKSRGFLPTNSWSVAIENTSSC